MTKVEVLKMLIDLIESSRVWIPDDSGQYGNYVVDHDVLINQLYIALRMSDEG